MKIQPDNNVEEKFSVRSDSQITKRSKSILVVLYQRFTERDEEIKRVPLNLRICKRCQSDFNRVENVIENIEGKLWELEENENVD